MTCLLLLKASGRMPHGGGVKIPPDTLWYQLLARWIAEGAKDDSSEDKGPKYNADNPPVYTRPPVITSIDYSPDGSLLAIAGFHEVLVHKADGSWDYKRTCVDGPVFEAGQIAW